MHQIILEPNVVTRCDEMYEGNIDCLGAGVCMGMNVYICDIRSQKPKEAPLGTWHWLTNWIQGYLPTAQAEWLTDGWTDWWAGCLRSSLTHLNPGWQTGCREARMPDSLTFGLFSYLIGCLSGYRQNYWLESDWLAGLTDFPSVSPYTHVVLYHR